MTAFSYCPQCGQERVSTLRYCSQCRFDFKSMEAASPSGRVTSLTTQTTFSPRIATGGSAPVGHSRPAATPTATPQAADEPSQLIPVIAGIAWLAGAAAIGYLAFLQLEYSGLGLADAGEARGLAIWNGVTAAITAYFGAMAIVAPTRSRMGGGVLWAAINVIWGGFQVSQGLSHGAFIAALVAFALAGVLAFVAWKQLRQQPEETKVAE